MLMSTTFCINFLWFFDLFCGFPVNWFVFFEIIMWEFLIMLIFSMFFELPCVILLAFLLSRRQLLCKGIVISVVKNTLIFCRNLRCYALFVVKNIWINLHYSIAYFSALCYDDNVERQKQTYQKRKKMKDK